MSRSLEIQRQIRLFDRIHNAPHPRRSEMDRRIEYMKLLARVRKYDRAHPDEPRPVLPSHYKIPARIPYMCGEHGREFFMTHNDDILSATGQDLDVLAQQFGVSTDLPTPEKQEEVYQAMADTYLHGNPVWSKEKIARDKKHFLETIEKTHFVNLTCKLLGMKEKTVRTWIHTDPEFAKEVHSAQVRFGERVAHATLVEAINGNLAAQMYVLKEFKGAVQFIDPDVEAPAAAAVTDDGIDVSKLSNAEQETLLALIRKAKNTDSMAPTEFIEEEDVTHLAAIESDEDIKEPPVPPKEIEYDGD